MTKHTPTTISKSAFGVVLADLQLPNSATPRHYQFVQSKNFLEEEGDLYSRSHSDKYLHRNTRNSKVVAIATHAVISGHLLC